MPETYEYRTVAVGTNSLRQTETLDATLNKAGSERWELLSVVAIPVKDGSLDATLVLYTFKRAKHDAADVIGSVQ